MTAASLDSGSSQFFFKFRTWILVKRRSSSGVWRSFRDLDWQTVRNETKRKCQRYDGWRKMIRTSLCEQGLHEFGFELVA